MKKLFPVALISAAAIVVPAQASKPADPGSQGKTHSHTTKPHSQSTSHKCKPHKVAWVVRGTLVSQALTKNTDGTYSGTVNIDVTKTNSHSKAEKGKTNSQYTLDHVKAKFIVTDQPPTGTVDETDLRPGDRVKLIGKITTLSKKCDQTGFTATTTIRQVVFHDPATP
jgi:hypothetical protein